MSKNTVYWIWLTNALGYNTPKLKKIYEMYSDVEEFYIKGEKEWRYCGIFTDKELTALNKSTLENAKEIISKSINLGHYIITFEDNEYPQCLYNIYSPPAVLYISGELPDIDNRLSIAIVGTRKPKEYGLKHSYNIAYNLAKAGVTIVSGGALGVDCASHRGALNAQGVTLCVLGCGINTDYLPDNAQMRANITFKGALISEYPPDTPPLAYHFPARNRIISALSDGVLIVEAGEKSGSLITANLALEQGKELFALMGAADSKYDLGSNKLIKDGCAIPVTEFKDILNSFENLYVTKDYDEEYFATAEEIQVIPIKGNKPEKINNKKTVVIEETSNKSTDNKTVPVHRHDVKLSVDEAEVYHCINNKPMHIDEISIKLNIKVFKVLPIVTKLELLGLIEATQGRCYRLK